IYYLSGGDGGAERRVYRLYQSRLAGDFHRLRPSADRQLHIDTLDLIDFQRVGSGLGGFETVALYLDPIGADGKLESLIVAFLVGGRLVFHSGGNVGHDDASSGDDRTLRIHNRANDSGAGTLCYQRRAKRQHNRTTHHDPCQFSHGKTFHAALLMLCCQTNLRAPPHERVTIAEKNWLTNINVPTPVHKNDSRPFLQQLQHLTY